ncbi:MAG: hypothetical protein QM741_06030 [Rudaea sp.]|uniref:hypothetical protein n=1 Tax=Rudaea sp. TaxID=2136325 RepID=UPI0039E57035
MSVSEKRPNRSRLVVAMVVLFIPIGIILGQEVSNSDGGMSQASLRTWHEAVQTAPRPEKGCYKAVYPSTQMIKIACVPSLPVVPMELPYDVKLALKGESENQSIQPMTVGGSYGDYILQWDHEPTSVYANFSISGVTSITGPNANEFSAQVNTNPTLSSPQCAGASNPSACHGWEQAVFANNTPSYGTVLLMQYWLLDYNNSCPSGWSSDGYGDCVKNSTNAVPVSTPLTGSTINTLSAIGITATPGSSYEYGWLSVGNNINTMVDYYVYGDDPFSLTSNQTQWRSTEINIFGGPGGQTAYFNNNSMISITIRVSDAVGRVGDRDTPTCAGGSTTAEMNNLVLGTCQAFGVNYWPEISFSESN